MNTYPLVSVAVVTYNQINFINECLDSILGQDYPNIEIVVADDFSTDGTREILTEYQSKNPEIFILKFAESNQGITANHNLAHYACSGKYIAWIGGDDVMLAGKLSRQVAFMEAHPDCNISYHQLQIYDSDIGKVAGLFNKRYNTHEGEVRKLIKYGSFNGAVSSMVRAESAPKSGFNTTIPIASDWLYYIECLINGGQIRYLDDVLGTYRRHSKNSTNEDNPRFKQNLIDHLNTCSIIVAKYPEHSVIALARYMRILRDNRAVLRLNYDILPYFRDLKSWFAYIIYIVTFKKIKL